MTDQAWVTLATNDSYAMGALVLARSLRRVDTSKKLAIMVTPGLSGHMREVLAQAFDVMNEVNILDSEDAAHLALMERPELGITFTKIHCWKLTQFSKCVFLDADTLVIQNCDELFDRDEFSAAPDAGWPDCFNSGVFVFRPSLETYNRIHTFALAHGSFDGGDQGLLNMYFSDWSQSNASRRLPFIYNMCASATYSYLPAFKVFGQNVKIIHFIGQDKPWLTFYDTATGLARPAGGQEHLQDFLQSWWNIFRSEVHPQLSPEMGGGDSQSATMVEQKGIAGVYAKMAMDGGKSEDQLQYEDQMRKMAWEHGHIDYMGKDSFDNIMKRIQASMAETTIQKPVPQRRQTPPKQEPPPKDAAPVVEPLQSEIQAQAPPQKEPSPAAQQPQVVEQEPPKKEATPPKQTTPITLEQEPPKKEATPPKQSVPPITTTTEQKVAQKEMSPPKQTATAQPPPIKETPKSEPEPTPSKRAEEDEERKAQDERQAIEKKLAEQKKAAEQSLEVERQAAAARAASSQPTPAPSQAKAEPKAPPRKDSNGSVRATAASAQTRYGVGLGLLGAAVVLAFAIYAAYSPTSVPQ